MKKLLNRLFNIIKRLNKLRIRMNYAKTIKRGTMEICWVDVDGMVYGWNMNADNELDLFKIAALISLAKQKKLENILAGKEESRNAKSQSKEDC